MRSKKMKNRLSFKLLAACLLAPSISDAQTRPNILFLFADDQRGGTIRALGNDEIITPNLDQLALNGTSYVNNYIMGGSVAAVSQPSRAMLMTGRHLFSLNRDGGVIPQTHVTMGEALRNVGYHTYGIGKWHSDRPAFNRCFAGGGKIFFGGMDDHWNVQVHDYDRSGAYNTPKRNPGTHSTDLFSEQAIHFINNHDARHPFFMYVSYMSPHDPRDMPKKYVDMYDTARIALPPNFMERHPFDNGELNVRDELLLGFPRKKQDVKMEILKYYAMITHMDEQIGNVIAALKNSGLYENTIIIFAADNGLAVGQHGLLGKQSMYEHSLNVPLIFVGKDFEAGKVDERFTYLHDIFPTICEVANIPVPASVQSQSVLSKEKREVMYYAYRNFQRAVRKDHFKLIEYRVGGVETTQLFDLKDDPWEINDLSKDAQYADILAEMKRQLLIQKKIYENEY